MKFQKDKILKLSIFCMIIMSCKSLKSQDVKIIYDNQTNKFSLWDKDRKNEVSEIKKGNQVWIIVENINPFLFDVNASFQSITKNPVPANLTSLVLGDFSGVSGMLTSQIQTLDDQFIGQGGDDSTEIPDCFDEDKLKILVSDYLEFIEEVKKHNDLSLLLKDENLTNESLDVQLNKLEKEHINEKYHSLKNLFINISLEKKNSTCKESSKYKFLSSIFSELIKSSTETEINKMEELRRNASAVFGNDWVVENFKVKGDEVKIELNITPRDEAKIFERPLKNTKALKKYEIKSDSKISFSSGLLLTSGFNDDNYNSIARQVNDSTTVYSILKEDEPGLDYGINAMINFIKNRDANSYGFTIGLGFLPREAKIAGLTGLTWLPGKKQRILISGGLGIAFRKTLSDALNLSQDYPAVPEIKRKNELAYSPWVSLAYRL